MNFERQDRLIRSNFMIVFLCISITLLPSINAKSINCSYQHTSQAFPVCSFMADGYGYSFTGEGQFNFAGLHVYGIGDINNDSFDDFVIGASQFGSSPTTFGYGKAYLYYGRPTAQWTDKLLSESDVSFIGENKSDTLGRWIAGLGDVNGDGFDDFAISAVGYDNWKGKTYIFFGGTTSSWGPSTSAEQASNASFIGEANDDHSGHGIYGVGDVNNDGFNDLMICGEWNDEGGKDSGQVYLIFGRPTDKWAKNIQLPQAANASFIGNTTIQSLGFDAAGIGDINNDSYSDIAVGAFKNETSPFRHVFIIFGRPTSHWQMDQPISQANTSMSFEGWIPSASNDWVSGVNDVNDDGYDDFIVGSEQDDTGGTDAGRTYLYFGRSTDQMSDEPFSQANVSFIGNIPDDRSGLAVAGAGDVNNDGIDDVIIGGVNIMRGIASWDPPGDNDGKVYLYYGRPTNQWQSSLIIDTADHSFTGENLGDSFGVHVAGIGDVNNDGFSDIVMSAVHYTLINDGPIAGKTYLILGNSSLEAVDLIPPVISNLVENTTKESATISFTTDEGSTVVIYYGVDTPTSSESVDTLSTSHEITISGLTANTTYVYYIEQTDVFCNSGRTPATGYYEFTTEAEAESATSTTTTSSWSIGLILIAVLSIFLRKRKRIL